jgi:hypothetical protein
MRLPPRAVPIQDSRLAAAEKEVMARLQNGGVTAQPAPLEVALQDCFEFPELPRKGMTSSTGSTPRVVLKKQALRDHSVTLPQV